MENNPLRPEIDPYIPETLEASFDFDEGGKKGVWKSIRNKNNGGVVEVESFRSNNPESHEKVVFIPGMPGDSVTWMKERYLDDLLHAGYDFDSLRHCGLKVTENTHAYVANKSREERGGIIGKVEARIKDWFEEVSVLFDYLEQTEHKDITVVSHSLGGLAVAIALLNSSDAAQKKIKKWINLSGATSASNDLEKPEFIEGLKTYVDQFVSPLYDFDTHVDASGDIFEKVKEFNSLLQAGKGLGSVRLISVYPEKDTLVNIASGEHIHENLSTGLLIDDKSATDEVYGEAIQKNPFIIHDHPHLESSTLVRLLDMKVSKIPHRVTVKK